MKKASEPLNDRIPRLKAEIEEHKDLLKSQWNMRILNFSHIGWLDNQITKKQSELNKLEKSQRIKQ